VFAACAFFLGAEQHLQKMSGIDASNSRQDLVKAIEGICHLSKHSAEDALANIESYAKKYYVIEHIREQGEIAADDWLSCREGAGENPFKKIIQKYRELTLADLGIEGVNPDYQLQQKRLYESIDRSVNQLRVRSLVSLILVLLIILGGIHLIKLTH